MITLSLFILTPLATSVGTGGVSSLLVLGLLGNFPIPINGVMRDLGASRDDFPVLAGSVGPSHGFVHVVDIGEPVEIFGMQVAHGDLVHADCHGALVVPRAVWGGLAAAIAKVAEAEAIILGPAGEPGFGIARLEEVWPLFEAART